MRCFISVRAPVDTNCEFQRILYCHEIKEWKKCTTKATKKMFMISLSVTLNYFFVAGCCHFVCQILLAVPLAKQKMEANKFMFQS